MDGACLIPKTRYLLAFVFLVFLAYNECAEMPREPQNASRRLPAPECLWLSYEKPQKQGKCRPVSRNIRKEYP